MPRKKILEIYELTTMTEDEIRRINPHEFMVFGTTTVKTSVLSQLPIEVWDKFTYEQLSYMNNMVFVYLKDEILELLTNKFKNNQEVIEIMKQIKDKSISIQVEPLWFRIENAKEKRHEMKEELNEAREAYKQLLEYNNCSYDTLIPKKLIRKALMIKSILKEYPGNKISKKDYLKWLDSMSTYVNHISLLEIPYIANFYYISFYYDIDYLYKDFQNANKKELETYQIGRLYMNYEDILSIITEI